MEHKWSHREIKAATKAAELVREQGRQMRKTAQEGTSRCHVDNVRVEAVKGQEDTFKFTTGHKEERRLSVAEYLADKLGIGGRRCGQKDS